MTQVAFLGVTDENSSPPMFSLGETSFPELVSNPPKAALFDSGRDLKIVRVLADNLVGVAGRGGGKNSVLPLRPCRAAGGPTARHGAPPCLAGRGPLAHAPLTAEGPARASTRQACRSDTAGNEG